MNEWKPIETAPKNPAGETCGPPILVWVGATKTIEHAIWTSTASKRGIETGWHRWSSIKHYREFINNTCTHWMPLPSPPTE